MKIDIKSANIQPFIILIIFIGFISGLLMRLGIKLEIITYLTIIGFFIAPFYILIWLMYRYARWGALIDKYKILRIFKVGYIDAEVNPTINTKIQYLWKDVKFYSIKKDRIRIFFNKLGFFNTLLFLDLFVKENSKHSKEIINIIQKQDIQNKSK